MDIIIHPEIDDVTDERPPVTYNMSYRFPYDWKVMLVAIKPGDTLLYKDREWRVAYDADRPSNLMFYCIHDYQCIKLRLWGSEDASGTRDEWAASFATGERLLSF